MTSKINTFCSSRCMQIIKNLGHNLSDRWSRCTGGQYIEEVLPKKLREDHNMVVKDR